MSVQIFQVFLLEKKMAILGEIQLNSKQKDIDPKGVSLETMNVSKLPHGLSPPREWSHREMLICLKETGVTLVCRKQLLLPLL